MTGQQVSIEVWADWLGLGGPRRMGTLHVSNARGKESFSFEYERAWLTDPGTAQQLDPELSLFEGPHYPGTDRPNFGLFLDSCPDRWGRRIMQRREAQLARHQRRKPRMLCQSDYLVGVHDGHRMGALRFKLSPDGPFVDDNKEFAAPPWTSLRELQHASLELDKVDTADGSDSEKWTRMLLAPGSSLGGARPKASVLDERGEPWIAKFPSASDDHDVGAWEGVVHQLAVTAGIDVPPAKHDRFSGPHSTFLTKRFDREAGNRIHFASALTLLQGRDGDGSGEGASYLEIADFIAQKGARVDADLEELWRRIVFFICTSNTDDHLRNHGFLLAQGGWVLCPAYDINPNPRGSGLSINISESDNALNLDLAREVAPYFRVSKIRVNEIIETVGVAVRNWRNEARNLGIPRSEQDPMAVAFEGDRE